MDAFIGFLQQKMVWYSILICVALILADAVLGWIKAYVEGKFTFTLVPKFIKSNLLPYIGGLLVIAFLAALNPDQFQPVFLTVVGLVDVKFGVDVIKEKVIGLFNSIYASSTAG